MTKHFPKEYIAIAVWGKRLGSYPYYIERQQEQAAHDGAPVDAIYKTSPHDGEPTKWRCVRDLSLVHDFRREYQKELTRRQMPLPEGIKDYRECLKEHDAKVRQDFEQAKEALADAALDFYRSFLTDDSDPLHVMDGPHGKRLQDAARDFVRKEP